MCLGQENVLGEVEGMVRQSGMLCRAAAAVRLSVLWNGEYSGQAEG